MMNPKNSSLFQNLREPRNDIMRTEGGYTQNCCKSFVLKGRLALVYLKVVFFEKGKLSRLYIQRL